MRDIGIYLTRVSPARNEHWITQGKNEALHVLINDPENHHARYEESRVTYDPIRKKILGGLAKGLTMASIENQRPFEENLIH